MAKNQNQNLHTCEGCGPGKTEEEMYRWKGIKISKWCINCMVAKQQAGRKKSKKLHPKALTRVAKSKHPLRAHALSVAKFDMDTVNEALRNSNKVHDDIFMVAEELVTLFEAQEEQPDCIEFKYNPDNSLASVRVMTKRIRIYS